MAPFRFFLVSESCRSPKTLRALHTHAGKMEPLSHKTPFSFLTKVCFVFTYQREDRNVLCCEP